MPDYERGHADGHRSEQYITRRPAPPSGWMRFEWGQSENENGLRMNECPVCGGHGSMWGGGGWRDPAAQELWDQTKDTFARCTDGNILRDHWSRFGRGECAKCGVKYWHDFGGNHWSRNREGSLYRGPWAYYHEPTDSPGEQVALF